MRATLIIVMALALVGCKKGGGNPGSAIATVAIAATMAAVQAARAHKKDNKPSLAKQECSRVCNACEVPCGDKCLPYGSFCYTAPGKACWESQKTDAQTFEMPEYCEVAPGFYVETGWGA